MCIEHKCIKFLATNGKKFYTYIRPKMTNKIICIASNMVTCGKNINYSADKSIHKDYNKLINPNNDIIQKERRVIKVWFG